MPEVTRRGFLRTASIGSAALGILAAAPAMVFAQQQPQPSGDPSDADPTPDGDTDAMPSTASGPASVPAELEAPSPWLLYVRDAGRGELAILSGEQELIFSDPGLLARIQQIAA